MPGAPITLEQQQILASALLKVLDVETTEEALKALQTYNLEKDVARKNAYHNSSCASCKRFLYLRTHAVCFPHHFWVWCGKLTPLFTFFVPSTGGKLAHSWGQSLFEWRCIAMIVTNTHSLREGIIDPSRTPEPRFACEISFWCAHRWAPTPTSERTCSAARHAAPRARPPRVGSCQLEPRLGLPFAVPSSNSFIGSTLLRQRVLFLGR